LYASEVAPPIAIAPTPFACAFTPPAKAPYPVVLALAPIEVPCVSADHTLPTATAISKLALELVPIAIVLFFTAFAPLPIAIALSPGALLPVPHATALELPEPLVFAASTDCIPPINANAANIPATTTFFLPVLFFAISDTTM